MPTTRNSVARAPLTRERVLLAAQTLADQDGLDALTMRGLADLVELAFSEIEVVGIMHAGGLSFDLIHHSLHALGSRMYGFTQELSLDSDDAAPADEDLAREDAR